MARACLGLTTEVAIQVIQQMKFAHPTDALVDEINNDNKFIAELKMDGSRYAMTQTAEKTELINRRGKEKSNLYPEFDGVNLPHQTILDGEMVVLTSDKPHGDFRKLQQRDSGRWNHKKEMLSKKWKATYVVFDVKMWHGRNLKKKPYGERREILMEEVKGEYDNIEVVPVFDTISDGWEAVVQNDMEGLVVKQYGSKYRTGRTSKWYRVKNLKDSLIEAYDYEEHSKGVTIMAQDSYEDTHRVNVNGETSKKVKEQLDSEDSIQMEVTHLGRQESGKFREPRFKRLVEG